MALKESLAQRFLCSLLWALAVVVLFTSLADGQINTCKYLFVTDFSSDPFGIARELRAQATQRGFVVITEASKLSADEAFKMCAMQGAWSASSISGRVEIRVFDASRSVIAEAVTGGTNWWGVGRTVRNAVAKLYSQIGYSGYDESAFQQKMRREYPSRPKFEITEEMVRKTEAKSPIEGIWTDPEDKYRLAIVRAPEGSDAQYFAVILRSNSLLWQVGEIKAEIRSTASPDVYTSTYYMANKKPAGTTLLIEHDAVMRASVPSGTGTTEMTFLRVWPTIGPSSTNESAVKGGSSGTGFLINKQGFIATNWHVVKNADHITVSFPGWRDAIPVDVVIRDVVNDLAILRMRDLSKLESTCSQFPYEIASSKSIELGQRISTIGYPLLPLLGGNPKFSDGVVSSKSGLQEDPRSFQITAPIQPGSSGSPLFTDDGRVVGIVVATLDAGFLYQAANALPQNINFAIKADYLLNLLEMLPGQAAAIRVIPYSPEKAAQCVATIRAS